MMLGSLWPVSREPRACHMLRADAPDTQGRRRLPRTSVRPLRPRADLTLPVPSSELHPDP